MEMQRVWAELYNKYENRVPEYDGQRKRFKDVMIQLQNGGVSEGSVATDSEDYVHNLEELMREVFHWIKDQDDRDKLNNAFQNLRGDFIRI